MSPVKTTLLRTKLRRVNQTISPVDSPSHQPQPGRLYVVSTPIGNLGDISIRARNLLDRVDMVACEDTRVTTRLMRHIGANTPLVAYHEHNEKTKAIELAEELSAGKSLALVSDAGTPGISDPGFRIVRECRRRGLSVEAVPGPCALTALLSVSGLPTNGFLFVGFLPAKGSTRRSFLEKHRDFAFTLALYESCHRIGKCLGDIVSTLGPERVVALGKELTKIHETVLVGSARNVAEQLASIAVKGEFTVLIAPASFEL